MKKDNGGQVTENRLPAIKFHVLIKQALLLAGSWVET